MFIRITRPLQKHEVLARYTKASTQLTFSRGWKALKHRAHQYLAMKAGTVIRKFSARDKCTVVLRAPRWEDLDDLLKLINSLVDEKADISISERVTREEEIDWLSRTLASLEKNEVFFLVAEAENRIVASSDLHTLRGYSEHVGVLGITIKNGYRDVGIGTEMMKALEAQARKMGLKVLTLSVFATNKRAIHVYEKMGFVATGRVPKKHLRDGRYIDEVIMTKVLG